MAREGTKKTVFTNFMELCKAMNRQLEHVQLFLLAELGTSGNLDGQSRLIVKGRFLPKAFEGVLRRYVNECAPSQRPACRAPLTGLPPHSRGPPPAFGGRAAPLCRLARPPNGTAHLYLPPVAARAAVPLPAWSLEGLPGLHVGSASPKSWAAWHCLSSSANHRVDMMIWSAVQSLRKLAPSYKALTATLVTARASHCVRSSPSVRLGLRCRCSSAAPGVVLAKQHQGVAMHRAMHASIK